MDFALRTRVESALLVRFNCSVDDIFVAKKKRVEANALLREARKNGVDANEIQKLEEALCKAEDDVLICEYARNAVVEKINAIR